MKRYTFFIEELELEAIKTLSDKTRVPIATYLREAISDLLKKYPEPNQKEES